MSLDQLLVTLCVASAASYLVRRKWNALRRKPGGGACSGGCGCVKGTRTGKSGQPGEDYSSTRSSS